MCWVYVNIAFCISKLLSLQNHNLFFNWSHSLKIRSLKYLNVKALGKESVFGFFEKIYDSILFDDFFGAFCKKLFEKGYQFFHKPTEYEAQKSLLEAIALTFSFLSLNDCGLLGLPKEIKLFKNLRLLELYSNNLTEESFPREFALLCNLEAVSLANNPLLRRIPSFIFQLTKLEQLHLVNNDLYHVPEEIGNLRRLKFLDLSINKLNVLPKSMEKLTQLVNLQLNFNQFAEFPLILRGIKNLKEVGFAFNFQLIRYYQLMTKTSSLSPKEAQQAAGWADNIQAMLNQGTGIQIEPPEYVGWFCSLKEAHRWLNERKIFYIASRFNQFQFVPLENGFLVNCQPASLSSSSASSSTTSASANSTALVVDPSDIGPIKK